MDYETIILEREERIATLTLNRPDKLNALSDQLFEDLLKAISEISRDKTIRVVIITGAGRGFSAGGDLDLPLFMWTDVGKVQEYLRWITAIPIGLRNLPQPVIAAVNGVVAGAGCSLVMACDIIITSEEARFSQAFVNVGHHPDMGSSYLLPRLVGTARACELIFTGKFIDAREMEKIGLVNQVVPADALMPTVKELAAKLADGPPLAHALAKRSIYQGMQMTLEQGLEYEVEAATLTILSEDVKEGVRAFKEKRKPMYKGK
jgi:2-(1,2-epoxy-1,2-dihydrophenyl)acetyl-CoA isomerase